MKKETFYKAFRILKNDGIKAFAKQTKTHISYKKALLKAKLTKKKFLNEYKDILFINDCPIDYCERYRIHHKMQELEAFGISCSEIQAQHLNADIIKFYRGFVIYRTPWTEHMDNFVKLAKANNKVVFYDIDDLVFDLKYTSTIKELDNFTKEQREEYDDGVRRYEKMLEACDYGISTTKVIVDEMKKHVKDACIDKNVASLQMQKFSNLALKEVKKDDNKIIIGYASGSITHNADFDLIAPALMKILDNYENVYLKLIGVLKVPDELKKYGNRILTSPFVDYTKLPYILRSLDINLAPLEDTFFNTAKSSIKWMEAGLVKIPTVASDVGNFHDSITDGVDGILCKDDEWYSKLEKLVLDKEYRKKIGDNAYKTVYNSYTPTTSGKTVADFIKKKLNKNICFMIPAANISGGILVATKHAIMLKHQGYDVMMINTDHATRKVTELVDANESIPVLSAETTKLYATIDEMVATMWFTVFKIKEYSRCKDFRYLVQNKESGFYEADNPEILYANASYNTDDVKYLTISKWCQNWLKDEFDKESLYAPNGIDLNMFPYKERSFDDKIKILIEGDPASYYKNVDEAFKITNKLDSNKYEIHFLSYNAEPKSWYRVDKFHHKVNHDEVYKVYQECDILLKTSILESFSYPPLEMMATGGVCVVCPNGGNIEYLKDKENCLLYEQGNIDEAIEKINQITTDKKLRDSIIKGGLETAKSREWKNIEKDILNLYK